jgi:hypothetical protein
MNDSDIALTTAYISLHSTVDRIAGSTELRAQFRTMLPREFAERSDDEIVRRLFTLRKCGRLPKQFRG